MKHSIDLEKVCRIRVTILIKKHFLANFIFIEIFCLKKGEKFLTKLLFSNISVQVGKNLIMLIGRGYLVTSKNFFNWVLKTAF